jgi:hypothetical protein
MGCVSPNANAISWSYQIGMRIKAGVHQSKGYALTGESGIRVQAKARRQNSESGFCIKWPCGLNRFVKGGITLREQYS